MKGKKIQKKILLYLDGDLLVKERIKMEEHFKSCSLCRKRLEVLSKVWKLERTAGRKELPPYLWTRLEERIKQYDYNGSILIGLRKQFDSFLRPAAFHGCAMAFRSDRPGPSLPGSCRETCYPDMSTRTFRESTDVSNSVPADSAPGTRSRGSRSCDPG